MSKFGYTVGEGLFVRMAAIRREEALSAKHSNYVDQFDWEKVIAAEDRTDEYLEATVRKIVKAISETERIVSETTGKAPYINEDVTFIDSEELLQLYPGLTPEQREDAFAKKHGTIFVKRIGHELSNGIKHGDRAADYDDWRLNGDIIIWNPFIDESFELSSMGIRVDKKAVQEQVAIKNESMATPFRQFLITEAPLTMGGGIGQSRLAMAILQESDIKEVQAKFFE